MERRRYPVEIGHTTEKDSEKEIAFVDKLASNVGMIGDIYGSRVAADTINEFSIWHNQVRKDLGSAYDLIERIYEVARDNPGNEKILSLLGQAQIAKGNLDEIQKDPFEGEYNEHSERLEVLESRIKNDKDSSEYFINVCKKERGPGPDVIVGVRLCRYRVREFLKKNRVSLRKKPGDGK